MGLLKDVGNSLVKIGGIVADKTEEYTKIAKHTIDLKKHESDLENIESKIGKIVLDRYEKNESMIEFSNTDLTKLFKKADRIKSDLEAAKATIEELKNERLQKKSPHSE
ncbi:hypothetical protein ACFL20_02115 [Spirochaetota bacterium]